MDLHAVPLAREELDRGVLLGCRVASDSVSSDSRSRGSTHLNPPFIAPERIISEPSSRRAEEGYLGSVSRCEDRDGRNSPSVRRQVEIRRVLVHVAVALAARGEESDALEAVTDDRRVALRARSVRSQISITARQTSAGLPPMLTSVPFDIQPPPALRTSSVSASEPGPKSQRTRTSWSEG